VLEVLVDAAVLAAVVAVVLAAVAADGVTVALAVLPVLEIELVRALAALCPWWCRPTCDRTFRSSRQSQESSARRGRRGLAGTEPLVQELASFFKRFPVSFIGLSP
jgi:hypothetical protein